MQQTNINSEFSSQIAAMSHYLSTLTDKIETVNQTALDQTSSAVSNLASIVDENGLRLDNKLASVETGLGSRITAQSVAVDLSIESVTTSLLSPREMPV